MDNKDRKLYLGIQNDRTEGILRSADIPHTDVTGMWWATDTRRQAFLPLFRQIDEHMTIGASGPMFKSYADAVALSDKIRSSVRFALQQWAVETPMERAEDRLLLFFDVERHQLLDRQERGISADPFVSDPRDVFLAKMIIGQSIVIGRNEYNCDVLPSWYRITRPPGLVTARGEEEAKWGVPSVEFAAYWGAANPLISSLITASRALWGHCYMGEDEASLKGASWFSYGYACAKYHAQQFTLAGASCDPKDWVLVDWVHTKMGPDIEEWMTGAIKAGWPGSFAVAGDWAAGSDDSPQTPQDQAKELRDEWIKYVATPFAKLTGRLTADNT